MDYQKILEDMTPINTKIIKIKYHADIPEIKMTNFGDWIDLYTAQNRWQTGCRDRTVNRDR